jgi:hypothetical protein
MPLLARALLPFYAVLPGTPTLWSDDADGLALFEARIRPLLSERCHPCHSVAAGKHKGGLLLDSRAGMLTGGDSGAALVAGEVEKSLVTSSARNAVTGRIDFITKHHNGNDRYAGAAADAGAAERQQGDK